MHVESHDRFDDVAEFDPETGALVEYSRATRPNPAPEAVQGHYARLFGTVTVLYRLGSSLWLRIGDEARDLDLASTEVRWDHAHGRSTLTLLEHGEPLAQVQYQPGPSGAGLDNDPTAFVEAEDWDFGLFVRNVLDDDSRRARIYGGRPAP